MEPERKNTVFSKIINEVTDEQLDGWTDWRFHLLTTGVYFCTEPKLRDQAILYSLEKREFQQVLQLKIDREV